LVDFGLTDYGRATDRDLYRNEPEIAAKKKGGPLPDRPFVFCDEPPDQRE